MKKSLHWTEMMGGGGGGGGGGGSQRGHCNHSVATYLACAPTMDGMPLVNSSSSPQLVVNDRPP